MGSLTTHVLDTANGCPAAGMTVTLFRLSEDGAATQLTTVRLNADGRSDAPLLDGAAYQTARYRLVFAVGAYFRSHGNAGAEPPFLDEVPVEFGLAATEPHYHVPLLASPWAYSTYRGS